MIDSKEDHTANNRQGKSPKGNRPKRSQVDTSQVDRLPPHSVEAEQGVLGCILQAPNECLSECVQQFPGSEAFYDLRHRTIYEVLIEMYDNKEAIDMITVQHRLKDKEQLEAVGGLVYLSDLVDGVPSPLNLSYYVRILREKHVQRKMVTTCMEVVRRVYEHEGDVDQLLDEVEREVMKISEDRVDPGRKTVRELVNDAINTIEDLHQRQGLLTGIASGYRDFDKLTSGMHGGEMIVLAARPSMGKTSLAMNCVENIIVEERLPVGVFSLEMTAESLVLRLICSRARVNLRDIREGFLSESDFAKLTSAAGKFSNAPLHIEDTPGLSILQLRAKARRMVQQHGIKLFVVDYLQLLHSSSARAENRQQEISDISNGLKALAKELNVPVVVLSQLNRELEKDKNRKPRLSDLRESGAIEQDADLVTLLYKPDTNEESEETEAEKVKLLIAKQRNGPTGEVDLTFLKGYTRFESMAKVDPDDVPADA